MKNKKKIIIISIIVCVIVGLILVYIFSFSSNRYDIDSIKKQCLSFYDDKNLRVMDFIDMTALFGTDFDDTSDAVFLSNINIEQAYTDDTMMIVVINDENSKYYYDLLKSHIDSYLMYSEDEILNKLYSNAILVSGKDYVYLIVSNDAKTIEKEINMFYR